MKKSVLLATAVLATTILSAATAFAVPVGSATFSPGSTSPTYLFAGGTQSLGQLTGINFKAAPLSTSSNSPTNSDGSTNVLYFSAQNVDSLLGSNLTIGSSAFTLTDTGAGGSSTIGTFVANAPVAVLNSSSFGNFASETIEVNGTLSGGSAEAGATLTGSLTFALSQTGGAGQSISLSGTLFTPAIPPAPPPVTVPEPASLALLGLGMLGLGAVRRRR